MRVVTTQAGDHTTVRVTSPWMSPSEAFVYLGISRADFYLNAVPVIPCARHGKRRLYHQDDLDAYMAKKRQEGTVAY